MTIPDRDWLLDPKNEGFSTTMRGLSLRVRREQRKGIDYWYAYTKMRGKTRKKYVGSVDDVTEERLDFLANAIKVHTAKPNEETTQLVITEEESKVAQLERKVTQLEGELNRIRSVLSRYDADIQHGKDGKPTRNWVVAVKMLGELSPLLSAKSSQ